MVSSFNGLPGLSFGESFKVYHSPKSYPSNFTWVPNKFPDLRFFESNGQDRIASSLKNFLY